MATRKLFALTAILSLLCLAPCCLAQSSPAPLPNEEYKAVHFPDSPEMATKLLSALVADGWEYVGPLNAGNVAFRRDPLTAKRVRLLGTWDVVTAEGEEKCRLELTRDGKIKLVEGSMKPLQAVFTRIVDPSRLGFDVPAQEVFVLLEGRSGSYADLSFGDDTVTLARRPQPDSKSLTLKRVK